MQNTLTYGLFQISFQMNASLSGSENVVSSQKAVTYLSVSPTGIIVSATPNAVGSLVLGSKQSLVLTPRSYSMDMDSLANISALNFTFYCMRVSRNVSLTNFLSTTNATNLASLVRNSSYFQSNTSCFNSSCNYLISQIIFYTKIYS
jgi:hypothetical protein